MLNETQENRKRKDSLITKAIEQYQTENYRDTDIGTKFTETTLKQSAIVALKNQMVKVLN